MTSYVRLFLVALFSTFSAITNPSFAAGEPVVTPPVPSKEVAIRVLALRDERFTKDYEIALVMPGETDFQGLTVAHAASVTFFGPVVEEGKKKRQLGSETFLWNEEYGWFLCEFGERLGRTTVFIWSEKLGEVEID